MASFYYNPNNKEDIVSQWLDYKQDRSYVKDIVKSQNATQQVIQEQLNFVRDSIASASAEQVLAIQESTSAVCGSLDKGFSLIESQLQYIDFNLSEIKSELSNIASILDWNFSIIIAEQKISNLLMGNVAELLRIPDIQKERQYFVEQGLKFLKNSAFDEDFYEDSLLNLKKAENIEATDYFILHHIGLIYLNSPKHINLPLAEDYFKRSAKYSVAETLNGSSITRDIIKLNPSRFFDEQISVDSIKLQAAESYLYAGRCCYIQGKMTEAAELAKKGLELVPELLEAAYLQAKSLSSQGNIESALKIMDRVIDKNRFYAVKMLSDLDFSTKNETAILLKQKKDESIIKAKNKLPEIEKIIMEHSDAHELVIKVKSLIESNNYLAAKKALDIIG
jgi:tetratricopeptide (TPR) repeat protein